jgi:hypothetical protein
VRTDLQGNRKQHKREVQQTTHAQHTQHLEDMREKLDLHAYNMGHIRHKLVQLSVHMAVQSITKHATKFGN